MPTSLSCRLHLREPCRARLLYNAGAEQEGIVRITDGKVSVVFGSSLPCSAPRNTRWPSAP
jgi:hypothetical protein